jgi:pyruvate dehydrogenase E1 component alpha subunit
MAAKQMASRKSVNSANSDDLRAASEITTDSVPAIDVEEWLHMYRQMYRIRAFEEQVNEFYTRALMPGLAHLYIGEEAVAVGVCEALTKEDYITSTHRGHGHCLAKGASPDLMLAELLGKAPGYCRGKGGSMHIADQDGGNLGANAIVGAGIGIATGAAFSAKMRQSGQVAVTFFGEGALGQGLAYEVMNMAALWKLPVLYVCENNLYNEYTHYSQTTAGELKARPAAFGIHVEEVDGQDIRQVHETARRLIERVRRGEGPAFLICNTYRYHGHHVGDINRAYYRPKEEEQQWAAERDPLKKLVQWLTDEGLADAGIFEQIEKEARDEIRTAADFAVKAPYPDTREVDQHVYA